MGGAAAGGMGMGAPAAGGWQGGAAAQQATVFAGAAAGNGMDPCSNAVLQIIQGCNSEAGCHVQEVRVCCLLGIRSQVLAVHKPAPELVNQIKQLNSGH
jgi:uncharacterized spore protein YtfJ